MIRNAILIVTIAAMLPMCSKPTEEAKPAEPETKPTEVEAKPAEAEAKPAEPEAKPDAPAAASDWRAEMGELRKLTAGLASLADTKTCQESHDAMMKYMDVHKEKLEALSEKVTRMGTTLPETEREAYKKEKAEFDVPVKKSLDTMGEFAQKCCNAKLKQEDAWALENKLGFIKTLKAGQ